MLSMEQILKLVECAKEAGNIAQKLQKEGLTVEIKPDGSKVTNADKTLDKLFTDFIRNGLKNNDIIISEEDVSEGNTTTIKDNSPFWSIDPIDSTNSFIKGNPYYSLNIAYIENGLPTFGLISAPAKDIIWYGSTDCGAFKQEGNREAKRIYTRSVPKEGAILMSSEEQITSPKLLKDLDIIKEIKLPSSIKFTYIAEGLADYYVRRRNKACDWDISSGHGLILAAGGEVTFTNSHENFSYGKPPYLAPALLAMGKGKTKAMETL